ncbi:hypothetical protein [Shinella yambaruensis]|uniref:hypothetical protein n=1 Tax=Shinella yambaruensis TaxID=415996 RepID=UPI003D7A9156
MPVAPLQMWVLSKAEGAGRSLASNFNIEAFNLGNATSAWPAAWSSTKGRTSPWCRSRLRCFRYSPLPLR